MCIGAIQTARIKRVVFGAYSFQTHEDGGGNRSGEHGITTNEGYSNESNNVSRYTVGTNKYSPAVSILGGVLEAESVTLLKRFFKQRRDDNKQTIPLT